MSKNIVAGIKLTIPAGKANPAPPIGPALGQKGVNIAAFCKEFNDKTKDAEPGVPMRVEISVYEDKKFTFKLKTSPASYYLKKYAKIDKGSAATKKEPMIASVTIEDCKEIAKIKLADLNAYDVEHGAEIIAGTAAAMGIEVIR
jgi:large subunit ribosomal protein L11